MQEPLTNGKRTEVQVGEKPRIEFNFGQVDAVLALTNRIALDKRIAFAGRLKVLQKLGVPERLASGRGKAGTYSFENVLQMAVAVELLQCGLTPQRAAEVVQNNWWLKLDEILGCLLLIHKNASVGDTSKRVELPWVWLVRINALDELTASPLQHRVLPVAIPRTKIANLCDEAGRPVLRAIHINVENLFGRIIASIGRLRLATIEDLITDIAASEPGLLEAAERFDLEMQVGREKFATDEKLRAEVREKIALFNREHRDLSDPSVRPIIRAFQQCISPQGDRESVTILEEVKDGMIFDPEPPEVRAIGRKELREFGFLVSEEFGEDTLANLTPFGLAHTKLWAEYWSVADVHQKA